MIKQILKKEEYIDLGMLGSKGVLMMELLISSYLVWIKVIVWLTFGTSLMKRMGMLFDEWFIIELLKWLDVISY